MPDPKPITEDIEALRLALAGMLTRMGGAIDLTNYEVGEAASDLVSGAQITMEGTLNGARFRLRRQEGAAE